MPALRMVRGPEPGKIYDLNQDSITIGRGRKNEIIIHDNEISREHCRLVRVLYDYEIVDLESTNGTFVNGRRITNLGFPLADANIIELGDSITLEYLASDSAPEASQSNLQNVPQHFFLVIRQAHQEAPEVYELDREEITLGRHTDNHIVLQAQEVSRFHLRLSFYKNTYTLEDAGATNGTHLNGNLVTAATPLEHGDYIVLGTVVEMWFATDLTQLTLEPRRAAPRPPVMRDLERTMTKRSTEKLTDRLLSKLNNGSGVQDVVPNSVFVVYARADWKARAAPLVNYLGRNNVTLWVDQNLTPETPEWYEAIDAALATCVCLVVVLTESALNAPHVQRSIRHFIAREKPVLVIRYEEIVDMPLMVQDLPMVDYNASAPERTYQALLSALNSLNLQM